MRIQKTELAKNLFRELKDLDRAMQTAMGPERLLLEVRISTIRERLRIGNTDNQIAA